MALVSPRASFRSLRTVPLEFADEKLVLLAKAIQQAQERLVRHPIEVASVTADYTALDIDQLIKADATTGNVTVTLPTAAGRTGRRIIVKKTDSTNNLVIIDPDGSETIDGSSSISLTQLNASREMMSDGTNWQLISAIGNATAL